MATARRRSEDAVSSLIEHAPIAIFVVDAAFRIRAANRRAEALFRAEDPVLGRDFADVAGAIWSGPFAADVVDRFRRTLATGEADAARTATFEWQIQRVTLPDGTAGVACYADDLSTVRDAERAAARAADERTRAEARLQDSEARLTLALEASGMGTFVWHLEDGRAEPDARTLELLGVSEAGDGGLTPALETLLHPDSRERLGAAVRRALDPTGSGAVHEDVCVRRPDGSDRWLSITARIVFEGEPPQPVRIAGIVADVDERKRIEESLRATGVRLTDADRRKDEFLAVLAHELRNPLAPIRAGLELIRLGGDDAAMVERTRAIMERQVGHMVRLIDDLLDVSRITSGKIHLQRRATPLDVLVATAVDASREAMLAARIQLHVALLDAPVWVDVDPTRGVQIVSNVLHNAVKFTDAGGEIRVTGGVERQPAGPVVALTISDSGVGIAAGMLPRVFDLFTQDRATSARSSTGLGIGLALARRLVELHGGSIEARSDGPGRGSAFTVRLPVAAAAGDPPPAATPRPAANSLKRRVVVIDDNLDAANAMAMLVAAFGGEARVAVDGPGGIEQVLAWEPDLVLLDIGMPGMDGFETCRRLRQTCGPAMAIVALTGWGQEQDKREAARAGFDAHLTKPADPAALERLLASIPERPR